MAGKHVSVSEQSSGVPGNDSDRTPVYPGGKTDRAYSEGRGGIQTANPHPAGTPEANAWGNGDLAKAFATSQLQTCWPAVVPPE